MRSRLSERDLNRIVRNVLNEAVIRDDYFYAERNADQGGNLVWPVPYGKKGTWESENNQVYLYDEKGVEIGRIS